MTTYVLLGVGLLVGLGLVVPWLFLSRAKNQGIKTELGHAKRDRDQNKEMADLVVRSESELADADLGRLLDGPPAPHSPRG